MESEFPSVQSAKYEPISCLQNCKMLMFLRNMDVRVNAIIGLVRNKRKRKYCFREMTRSLCVFSTVRSSNYTFTHTDHEYI